MQDGVTIRLNPYARKDSGSFYTPQELVDLIVERTLKPLAEERRCAFEDTASNLRPKAQRLAELRRFDPAEAVLALKILDPAMGSGHFLVAAVNFLSDTIAESIEYVPTAPAWLNERYESPVVARIERIRRDILARAHAADWTIDSAQLTDRAIIRRMYLARPRPRMTTPRPRSANCGRKRRPLPSGKAFCTRRPRFPGCGAIGRAHIRGAVSTRSSATRPGTAPSCKRWNGSPAGRSSWPAHRPRPRAEPPSET